MSDAAIPSADIDARIAARLRGLRQARGLSLDGLAAAAGVSRAMLSRIERGESSATAHLLNRIAAGLATTLSDLLAEPPAAPARLRRLAEQSEWVDPASQYRRRAISPPGTALEVVEVVFPPGGRVGFDNRGLAGRDQLLWLREGVLEITLGAECHVMAAGDCLHTGLDQPIVFHNPGPDPARYVVLIGPFQPVPTLGGAR
ncbi:MAG: helix-turn-helix transcriptional regulator [Rhodospirillales bacterium]|nr:helix-turn-helix transcriptional regulator [Rhodospirillales bacterium]